MPNKIKEYRLKNNLTQEKLAGKLNLTRQAVTRWENGNVEPSTENLIELAKLFNCKVDDLIGNSSPDITNNNKVSVVTFWTIDKQTLFTLIFSTILIAIYFFQMKHYYISMTVFFLIEFIFSAISTLITAIIHKDIIKRKNCILQLVIVPLIILFIFLIIGLILEL